jgi:hypothetical protein
MMSASSDATRLNHVTVNLRSTRLALFPDDRTLHPALLLNERKGSTHGCQDEWKVASTVLRRASRQRPHAKRQRRTTSETVGDNVETTNQHDMSLSIIEMLWMPKGQPYLIGSSGEPQLQPFIPTGSEHRVYH